MYAFLNDISISPDGVVIEDNWSLIQTVMDVLSELGKSRIELLRVPQGFSEISIAGSHTIGYYIDPSSGTIDHDQLARLYGFLGNQLDERDETILKAIAPYEDTSLMEVYLHGKPSLLLTEAYLLQYPTISFGSSEAFKIVSLPAELHKLDSNEKMSHQGISIENFHELQTCFQIHSQFLFRIFHGTVFSQSPWNPQDRPIWNSHTLTMLTEIGFPQSIHGLTDKKAELFQVGTRVAEMNGFVHDMPVSQKNRSKDHLRKIFRSVYGTKTAYLSIDFEKASGCFELLDHRGVHLQEITFLGVKSGDADGSGKHSIRL